MAHKEGHNFCPVAYRDAQSAMAILKAAVVDLLAKNSENGLPNAAIGRALGIYAGHQGHEGHIPRTLLHMLETEGVAIQDATTKRWSLRSSFE